MYPYEKHSINIHALLEFAGISLPTETRKTIEKPHIKGRKMETATSGFFIIFKLSNVEFNYIQGKGNSFRSYLLQGLRTSY